MSSFKFCCPHCHHQFEAEEEWDGLPTECPACHATVVIPKPLATHMPITKVKKGNGLTRVFRMFGILLFLITLIAIGTWLYLVNKAMSTLNNNVCMLNNNVCMLNTSLTEMEANMNKAYEGLKTVNGNIGKVQGSLDLLKATMDSINKTSSTIATNTQRTSGNIIDYKIIGYTAHSWYDDPDSEFKKALTAGYEPVGFIGQRDDNGGLFLFVKRVSTP